MHYLKALGKTVTVKIISLRHINLFTKHMIDLKTKYYWDNFSEGIICPRYFTQLLTFPTYKCVHTSETGISHNWSIHT